MSPSVHLKLHKRTRSTGPFLDQSATTLDFGAAGLWSPEYDDMGFWDLRSLMMTMDFMWTRGDVPHGSSQVVEL